MVGVSNHQPRFRNRSDAVSMKKSLRSHLSAKVLSFKRGYRRALFVRVGLFLLPLVAFLLASCTDDVHYSADPSLRLRFDADTVAFDPLLTGVGSSTAVLGVYNPSREHLSIAQVTLAGGSASPFRVNVDGQYGTSFADVELRSRDSLFVFIEVTPPVADADAPLVREDSLVFTLQSGVQQRVVLTVWGQDAVVLRGAVLDVPTVFTPRRPYLIYDSLVVAPTATLTLQPGTQLLFHHKAELIAHGTLQALGTPDSLVVLRGDRLDNMFSYLPYDRINGQWGGITLHPAADVHRLDYCDIHGGEYGIRAASTLDEPLLFSMQGTQVHNVDGDALQATLCDGVAVNCLFTNAGGHCVDVLGGAITFLHCTIANFFPWKAERGEAVHICNVLTEGEGSEARNILYPLTGVDFISCIITGSKDDEVSGTVTEGGDTLDLRAAAQYSFSHSLVNSKEDDSPHFTDICWESPDSALYGRQNFVHINADNTFRYDFHLDSLSRARGIADDRLLPDAPLDRDGRERTAPADAGCYQYRP